MPGFLAATIFASILALQGENARAEPGVTRDPAVLAQAPGAAGSAVPAVPPKPAVSQPPAPAAAPATSGGPRFEVRRFEVQGATLISQARIDAALAPFIGAGRDFGDVQRALEVLERLFVDAGYGSVQVLLPEQELEQGNVRFQVIEPKIGKVSVEGNSAYSEANVRASLPALKEGAAPNSGDISANLRLANENPGKATTVLLRAGSGEGEVDAVVRVVEDKITRWNVSFDNSGTSRLNTTGSFRLAIGMQTANVWGRDHVIGAQIVTSPEQRDRSEPQPTAPDETARLRLTGVSRDVAIFGVQYRIPLYGLGDFIDFSAGYSNVNSGVVSAISPFNISGRGSVFGVRYTSNLRSPSPSYEHRMIYAADWRIFSNNVVLAGAGASLVPDITVHPVSATYVGTWRPSGSETSFYLGYHRNIPGGNDGGSDAFDRSSAGSGLPAGSNAGARPGYSIWRFGFSHLRQFAGDWQFRFNLSGQVTQDRLVSPEQFGMGGAASIRGLTERQFALDNGVTANVEVYTPELGQALGLGDKVKLRLLAFHDTGHLTRNQAHNAGVPVGQGAGSGEVARISASGSGVGVRVGVGNSLSMRLDAAFANLPGDVRTFDTLTQVKQFRIHGSVVYLF